MVSAWANSQQMVLGQLATDEKSNEITAVPELLEMLDVAGCIILTTEIEWFENRAEWSNLKAFGMVHSRVEQQDRITEDNRCFITSLEDVSVFADAARKHWGIENSLHWCLDMTFREDYSRIRKDHSAENMVVVRHMELNILKNYPAKTSLARKRHRCAYDDVFFADVMNSVHA